MEKTDARKLSPQTQEQLRMQAIRLRKSGMKYIEIAKVICVHRNTVSQWWKAYESDGQKGLKSKRRGRRYGDHRSISIEQEKEIQKLICDKTPDQYKLTFALWTRQAVQELIKLQLGISMPIRTVGEYLKRWGFTPQKPLRRAYEQQPVKVEKWLKEEYPQISQKAKQENAEIHWGDETGIRSDCQHGRSYSPKGKTPVIRLSAKRSSINMISTVTNQGKVRFMLYQTSMNTDVFIKFLKQLIKDADKKILLILDNLRVHHAKIVTEWLEKHKDEIEVFFLPPYCPELNPDEYLNCDLKAGVHSKPPARNSKELETKVNDHMNKLQMVPQRVIKYFHHPKIAYAA